MQGSSSRTKARDRILRTASDLFYAEGVRAVGVDKVIEEAKVAKATLYAHFRSKNDLVEAYLRSQADDADEDLRRIEEEHDPGAARIAAVFDSLAESAGHPHYQGCCFINAAAEHLDPGSRAQEIIADHRKRLLEFLAANVDRAERQARLEAARVVMALLDGAKVASVSDGAAAVVAVRQAALALAGAPFTPR